MEMDPSSRFMESAKALHRARSARRWRGRRSHPSRTPFYDARRAARRASAHFFPCRAAGLDFAPEPRVWKCACSTSAKSRVDEIAFRTVSTTLQLYFADRRTGSSRFTRTRSRPRGPCPVHDSLVSSRPTRCHRSNRRSRFRMVFSPHRTILKLSLWIAAYQRGIFPRYGRTIRCCVVARSAHGPHDRCVQGLRVVAQDVAPRGARGDACASYRSRISNASSRACAQPRRARRARGLAARSSRLYVELHRRGSRTRWKCGAKSGCGRPIRRFAWPASSSANRCSAAKRMLPRSALAALVQILMAGNRSTRDRLPVRTLSILHRSAHVRFPRAGILLDVASGDRRTALPWHNTRVRLGTICCPVIRRGQPQKLPFSALQFTRRRLSLQLP